MKKVLFNIVMIYAAVALTQNVQAQSMVAEGTDSVTVGSLMPYTVEGDTDIQSMVDAGALDPSQFDWHITAGIGNIETTTSDLNLFPDSISVKWPENPGTATISVAENTIKNDNILCSDGSPSLLNVVILEAPTIEFTKTDTGACASTDYEIPLTLTGIAPWNVTYTITHTNLEGVSTDVSPSNPVLVSNNSLPISVSQLSHGPGTYSVQITNVDDRISSKALNEDDVNGIVGAKNTYTIYVFPTPNTGSIQHISN